MRAVFSEEELDSVITVLKALAHELRLKLMHALLEHGERSVSELENLTGIGQPALSQQLAILRKAHLVQTRRRAKLIFYRLAPDNIALTARLMAALAATEVAEGSLPSSEPRRRKSGSAATFARII
jgi:DNA-binding transcriptional ArsR family regulator